MKRRSFFRSVAALSAGWSLGPAVLARPAVSALRSPDRGTFSLDANRVRLYTPAVADPLKVLVVADTHLWMDDERGEPYRAYSARMAGAYNRTKHFETGEPTHPVEGFEQILKRAVESEVDLLALVGDIFSFPSELAVEWVRMKLAEAGVPYLYVAGNHDWHYEGMEGTLDSLRRTWIEERLLPLYQGNDPLFAAYEVKGIRFLAVDNSTYEILPEQLEAFREEVRRGSPLVLFVHIPFYAPGRRVSFGCGHPEWGAETDGGFELERRERWPAAGHTETTFVFRREVFAAENVLAVFAGHIHKPSVDVVAGVPQVVTDANATGAFLDVGFHPLSA